MKRDASDVRKRKKQVRPLQRKMNELIFIQAPPNHSSNNSRLAINFNISSYISMTIVCNDNSESDCYPTVCGEEQAFESVLVVLEILNTITTPLSGNTGIKSTTTQSMTDTTSTTQGIYSSMMMDNSSTTRNTKGSSSAGRDGNENENENGTSDNKSEFEEFVSRSNEQTGTVALIIGIVVMSVTLCFIYIL